MGDCYPTVRVGAVQASPVFLNREATVEKACRIIREAGRNGARIIGFPEGFIPAHPVWYHFRSGMHPKSMLYAKELFKNSIEIPSPAIDAICAAAKDANAYVVMGACEKLPGTTGTLYNSQIVIGPDGSIIGTRRKIMPTTGERLVHAGGSGQSVRVFDTEFGPISGLICGENSNPLAIFAITAMQTRIHVASWPLHFKFNPMADLVNVASRSLAYQACCFVINAAGVVTDELIDAVAETDEDRAFLERCRDHESAVTIVGPNSQVVAGPLGPGEGILYADLDLEQCLIAKNVHDWAGHYNRADIFTLTVNRDEPQLYRIREGSVAPEAAERSAECVPNDQRTSVITAT